MSLRCCYVFIFLTPLLINPVFAAGTWSGNVALEYRYFTKNALDNRQHGDNWSFSAQPEYFRRWDGERQSFTFVPFLRIDENDPERSHFDIRELTWVKANKSHEWRIGIRKVYWGVTESQHLVDIINQTDLVENIDTEDKLGQPMVNLSLVRDWGTLDFFVLPGFRERTFPGVKGRLRSQPRVDTDQAVYESSSEQRHVDVAMRWSHSIGNWDIGLSYFSGTSRDPRFVPGVDSSGAPVLVPYYDQMRQTSLDLQWTIGNWLWKLEAIARQSNGVSYNASVTGFEYTFTGIFKSKKDLGVLLEYHHDSRGTRATTPFQDDIFIGFRLSFNDRQSTELLFGSVRDRDNSAESFFLETSRRFGSHWKGSLEIRSFRNAPPTDLLFMFRNEDVLQLELAYYF
ncbi:MAG: hypothetical protein BMS9Abin11_0081 [Gammaproteobacteria bacterium]|nr:MAG: hypothetical protein BMS9Abin11_0081 [Gammaproteobacteria bacterium]